MQWGDFHRICPAAGTFSKDPRAWGFLETDRADFMLYGRGSKVKDSSGRMLIDWVSGLGANLFGHAQAAWTSRFIHRLNKANYSTCFSLPHLYEFELAEELAELCNKWVRGKPKVRFGKTGSDALDMAVRLARAVTGKPFVFYNGYHGWHDWYISSRAPAHGIPAAPYSQEIDLKKLHPEIDHADEAAALVVEIPINFDRELFSKARWFCNETGALLILDEVVTGFRYGIPGYCERLEKKADLICFGKALGNGLPISAVVGPTKYMNWFARQDPVFCSSTSFGDTFSLAAGLATLETIDRAALRHIREIGATLIERLSEVSEPYDFFMITGDPERSLLVFTDDTVRGMFIHGMMERGILMNRPNFPTVQHTADDVEKTVQAAAEVLEWINSSDREKWQREPLILFRRR